MTVSVIFKGGAALQAALRELGNARAINAAGREGLMAGAEPIRDVAKTLVRKDLHKLEESIKAAPQRPGRGGDRDHLEVAVGIDASVDPAHQVARKSGRGTYRDPGVAGEAVFNEFGAGSDPGKPFMTPAMAAELPQAAERIGAALWPAIQAQAAKLAKKV